MRMACVRALGCNQRTATPEASSLQGLILQPSELPVVIVAGSAMRRATPHSVADYLGLTVGRPPGRVFDLVVIGAGPAGVAAAVYRASEGLGTLGVDAVAPGGQAGDSTRMENVRMALRLGSRRRPGGSSSPIGRSPTRTGMGAGKTSAAALCRSRQAAPASLR
jgi:hypothetical protein